MSLLLLFPGLGTPAIGDSDTYHVVSAFNPDTLDLYVEGVKVTSWVAGTGITDHITRTIAVDTENQEGLILRSTDDNSTKNLIEAKTSDGTVWWAMKPGKIFTIQNAARMDFVSDNGQAVKYIILLFLKLNL